MALAQKIGQLFLLGFQGHTLETNSSIFEDITKRNLGGVLLFDRLLAKDQADNNIITKDQVKRLTTSLQGAAGGQLLIAIDQEGGKVSRLSSKRGFPDTPTAATLGGSGKIERTRQQSTATAALLRELGITFNLAPVVDINSYRSNPIIARYERSFSHDPYQVLKHAQAWIRGHRQHGILTCLKHFPGHGSARQDTHLGFADISDTWNNDELIPFASLITSGDAEAIMTGHLFNTQLDQAQPTTLSQTTLTTLLRGELAFKGVIISDDMQMRAITDKYGLEHAICLAIAAGVDLVIIGNNLNYDPNILEKVIKAIQQAIADGILTEQRLTQAYERVQALKRIYRGWKE